VDTCKHVRRPRNHIVVASAARRSARSRRGARTRAAPPPSRMLAGLLTCPLSVLSLSATPLPQRWSVRDTGLCGGGIAPSATTCSGHAVPGFSTSEAAWPFQKTGYEDAAFAAAACKKTCAGCIAVTCGPGEAPAPQNITAWCWARSQNNAFCTVPGYSSFSDFPKPPPPPPAFRLPSIFADHMVLQRATAPPGP
jgi:hypothetical protein